MGICSRKAISGDQTEFNELQARYRRAFKSYSADAEKASTMLANRTAEPLPLTQRLSFQERAEDAAHLIYLGAKRLLHNAERLGSSN